ncbi:hypothetical protein [Natranaerobius thermophilus]|uniref:Uncharacterized protein n=1 Tax=Natranaerobius thermophilus (strain ATCC BAA-1301 / DSM 18059 / JW/NM-WN-LF) TaxID=457570 RepID=B2A208_NATTJ|nr:hypothetical protein [Natranaerobius thermophilus]ACB84813.1 hypothetical protein Nther_1230 [Natranaerobius thermophilus JW/NM-WN-LF]
MIENDFKFLLNQIGKPVKIDDGEKTTRTKAIISTHQNNFYKRIISTLYPIESGNIIEFDNQKFMITEPTYPKVDFKYKAVIEPMFYQIAIFDHDTDLFFFTDAIIKSFDMGMEDTDQFIVPTDEFKVILQRNDATDLIVENDYFYLFDFKWVVMGIDKTTPGVIKLTVEQDEKQDVKLPSEDDTYILISGETSVHEDSTYQYQAIAYQGVEELDKEIKFSIANDVDSEITEDGELTVKDTVGTTIEIKAELEKDSDIYRILEVSVADLW